MAEFLIGGNEYKSGRLDARTQFHIARRLAPIFSGLAAAIQAGGDGAGMDFAPIADAISGMNDQDVDYVLTKSMSVVSRKQGDTWVSIQSGAAMMFEDIDMMGMIQIAWHVLQENLSGFFRALPTGSLTAGMAPAPQG